VTKATARGVVAVGDRDPGVGRARDARGDAGHDLERDPALAQRLGLLAAAAEDEGSPPLSRTTLLPAGAARPAARSISSCGTRAARLLADVDQLGVRRGARQRAGGIRRS
jgi:hypothetical protein